MSHPLIPNNSVDSKKKISDETKIYIVEQLIEPSYKNDIDNLINDKKCWKSTGITFETISKIMVAISGVFSFSSGYFQNPMLSFISGSIATLSLALLQFSGFSYSQNKKTGDDLNVLLKSLDLETIPVLARSSDDGSGSNAKMRLGSPANIMTTNIINNDDISNGSSEHEKLEKMEKLEKLEKQTNLEIKLTNNEVFNNLGDKDEKSA